MCVWLNLKIEKERNMNLFFYLLLFIMGTLFGSFYTLAVYRIPKKQDITHTHSYCPNCNHKLGFLDLIPIISYIFLRGRCRYCKEKIRARYIILEIMSGILFVAFAFLMNFKIGMLNITAIAQYAFIVLYLTYIILISGIDKENRKIDRSISIYGMVISIMYIVYLYIVEQANIYRYGIYIIFYIIVLIVNAITLKKWHKNSYVTGISFLLITMVIFTGEYITGNAIIFTLLTIFFLLVMDKIKQKNKRAKKPEKQLANQLSIGFLLGTFNILMLMSVLFLSNV